MNMQPPIRENKAVWHWGSLVLNLLICVSSYSVSNHLFCIQFKVFFVEKMWKRKTGCNADMKSFVLTCMMSTTRIYCRERKQSSVVTRNDCRSSKSYLQTSHFLLRSNSSFIMFLLPFPSDLLNFLSHHRVIHIISLNWCLCALEPLV